MSWWTKVIVGVLLLAAAILLGRDFGHHVPAMEAWIAAQGVWGYVVFVGATIVLTSLFVPDTVFAVMAGVLFGVVGGTAIMTVSCLLAAAADFAVSRLFLEQAVRGWLVRNPRLAAIERAVNREGFRFQFLLRLTPINPATVSYVLGATGTRFAPFMIASLGLVPSLLVEVYFGYVAKHVASVSSQASEHSALHTAATIAGLLVCIVVLVYVVRLAQRALAESENSAA